MKPNLEIILANPRGFCAGVEVAIEIVEKALKKYGSPIYVRHEIVHNDYVVSDLKRKGAIFVEHIGDIPEGSVVIFSAHGVSKEVERQALDRKLHVIDATCFLVKKVHNEAQRYVSEGKQLIIVGHANHPEVEGTSGRVDPNSVFLVENINDVERLQIDMKKNIAYVTQTTLSVDDTKEIVHALQLKYPNIEGPSLEHICYATQNRQDAVKNLVKSIDVLFVIGSQASSNSNRLKDIGQSFGISSYLINDSKDINLSWLRGIKKLGVTAGASAPEVLLKNVLDFLGSIYNINVIEIDGIQETLKFRKPRELEGF